MARRNKPPNRKEKDSIKTTQLENRLHNAALGKIEMSATSIRAAEIWLRKHKPDLQAIEHQGNQEVTLRTIVTGVRREGDE